MEIAETLWGLPSDTTKYSDPSLQAYFEYYRRQWDHYRSDCGLSIFNTFSDFAVVVEQIKNGESRTEILSKLQEAHQDKGYVASVFQASVDLTARLLTIVSVGEEGEGGLVWEDGSLQSFLGDVFERIPSLDCEKTAFGKGFNAWSVEKEGGMAIEFTDYLAEHLKLVRGGGAVRMFHHVSFLEYVVRSKCPLLPDGLAEETLKTLSLLFPKSEFGGVMGIASKKGKWLKAACSTWESKSGMGVDPQLFRRAGLVEARIKGFNYHRDRLVLVKEKYDQALAGPKSSVLTETLFTASAQSAWA